MMKLYSSSVPAFQNTKCGEVFYVAPTKYNVKCSRCGENLKLEEFPEHFEEHHTNFLETGIIKKTEKVIRGDALLEIESNSEMEGRKRIEFLEVRLPKLKSGKINSFIPEHTADSIYLVPETLSASDESRKDCVSNESSFWDNSKKPNKVYSSKSSYADGSRTLIKMSQNKCIAVTENETFTCEFCSRIYKTIRTLKHHLTISHSTEIEKQITTITKHKCELCGEIFGHVKYLKSHMWKHTGYVCPICDKSFTQLSNLHSHKKRHTGIKEHKCQQCDYRFYTVQELKAHIMKHTDSLPVVCEVCGRRFRNTGKLKAHMRRHTGERPATCGVCGKSFYSFHDLNMHSVTHTTDRPFSCDICNSSFQTKKALRVHKKLHMTERNYKCERCDKAFALAGGLNAHMRVVHPV